MIVRLKDGENLTKAHRKHLYQLLVNEYGLAHWKVSLGYGMFQLMVGMSVILLKTGSKTAVISALVLYFCSFTILSSVLRKRLKYR